jgi:hypothetical protein
MHASVLVRECADVLIHLLAQGPGRVVLATQMLREGCRLDRFGDSCPLVTCGSNGTTLGMGAGGSLEALAMLLRLVRPRWGDVARDAKHR